MIGARRAAGGVFLLALAARLFLVLHSGGFLGDYGPVYYTASESLLHGRVPYRDFVLIHPPGIMLALAPFAQLGRLTTDHTGFVAANVIFLVLGAVNAALVVAVARRMGLSIRAAAAGGAFYALWSGSTGAEYLVRLEPLGNFLLLLGLFAFFTARRSEDWRWPVLAGLALGAAAGVKIWWSLPLAIVLLWPTVTARWRRDLALKTAGAATALGVIMIPFFALAPRQMVDMVVFDQMGRHDNDPAIFDRLRTLTSLDLISSHLRSGALVAAIVALALLFAIACSVSFLAGPARLVAVLTGAQVAVLLIAPSFYWFYADYAAPGAALTLAVAAHQVSRAHSQARARTRAATDARSRAERAARRWAWRLPVIAFGTAVAAMAFGLMPVRAVPPGRGSRLTPLVSAAHCVTSDSPMLLIRMNVLSRDLERGCQVWVDVSGTVLGPDAMTAGKDGRAVPPQRNPRWQRDVTRYLLSGDATMVVRPQTGLDLASWRLITAHGVLAASGNIVIYRTRKVSNLTPVTDLAALTHW
jgi:alpha-1,2-mannosyltransferase